jgi:cytoskeletal protein CcmA (bactofilin family)
MFGGNNKNEASKSKSRSNGVNPASHSLNSLVQGTVVEGTVKSESDIRIDGTIKGKLFCDAKVIIGPKGAVEGEIRCQNAVIEGTFQGMLEVRELLNVRENASISGEVSTNKLIVQSGATFNVTCSMGGKIGQQQRKASQPESTRTNKSDNQKIDLAKGSKAAGGTR